MELSNVRFSKSFLVFTVATLAAVGIGSATVLFLRPRPEQPTPSAAMRDVPVTAQGSRAATPQQPESAEIEQQVRTTVRADLLQDVPASRVPDVAAADQVQDASADRTGEPRSD